MPIYEYLCHDCRHKFDVLRRMSQADEPLCCEKCASENCSRVISVFYAHSEGRNIAGTAATGCTSCTAGSCAGCSH